MHRSKLHSLFNHLAGADEQRRRHVEAERAHVYRRRNGSHADDMTVRVQAKGKTRTGRLWTYVRDDRPFGRPDPPAAAFFYSPYRGGEHPESHLAYRVALRRKYSPSILPNNLSNHPQQPKATHCISPPASMKREIFLAPLDGKSPAKIEALYVIESLANDGLRSLKHRHLQGTVLHVGNASVWRIGLQAVGRFNPLVLDLTDLPVGTIREIHCLG